MRKVVLATLALLAGTVAANAVPITFTYSLSDTNSTNGAAITTVLPSPDTINLSVGGTFTGTLFTLHDTSPGTSTITANFTFTAPTSGSGSPTGSDVFTTLTGNRVNDTFSPLTSSFVDFGAAGILGISFDAATTGNNAGNSASLDVPVTFTLNAPSTNQVPEPLTLSLFGAGLVGLGAMRRRRKAASL